MLNNHLRHETAPRPSGQRVHLNVHVRVRVLYPWEIILDKVPMLLEYLNCSDIKRRRNTHRAPKWSFLAA
jgi:hypothetical protein